MKLISATAAILIGSILWPSQASAWKLETHPKGYILTCGDGFQGWFEKYPTEFAANTACANHGGIIYIEPTVSPRLDYMKNQELTIPLIKVEPTIDSTTNDTQSDGPVRRMKSSPKSIETVPPRQ